jgi:hypothetical protein
MFRATLLLVWLLVLHVLVGAATVAAIVLFGYVCYCIFGGDATAFGTLWSHLRATILSGLTVFSIVMVLRWLLVLIELRRQLKAHGVSLLEFASWPGATRAAWSRDQAQEP